MSKAISLPFSFDVDGRISYTTDDKKAIQDRVVLVIMTLLKERVMRPGFGTNTRTAVFETPDIAVNIIKQEIATGFSKWLSYLNLIDTNVSIDVDNVINITIDYKVGGFANTETVTVKTASLTKSGDIITEVPYGQ